MPQTMRTPRKARFTIKQLEKLSLQQLQEEVKILDLKCDKNNKESCIEALQEFYNKDPPPKPVLDSHPKPSMSKSGNDAIDTSLKEDTSTMSQMEAVFQSVAKLQEQMALLLQVKGESESQTVSSRALSEARQRHRHHSRCDITRRDEQILQYNIQRFDYKTKIRMYRDMLHYPQCLQPKLLSYCHRKYLNLVERRKRTLTHGFAVSSALPKYMK